MEKLKKQLEALSAIFLGGRQYLSYQAVTDTVATFLFPNSSTNQMAMDDYQRILETAVIFTLLRNEYGDVLAQQVEISGPNGRSPCPFHTH